jgi:hypothetical protein
MFSSNEELYQTLKDISNALNENGNTGAAKSINDALYSGCTSGEVLNDILGTLLNLQKQNIFTNTSYESTVNEMIKDIKKALNIR